LGIAPSKATRAASFNLALGTRAGWHSTAGNDNIFILNEGAAGDDSVIKIGTQGTQAKTYIAGISGVTAGGSAVAVVVDTNGQLGTVSSSRRFKQDIQDMGDVSQRLAQLRPVTFRYIQPAADGTRPLQTA
jgi:hypothetical protein